MLPSLGLRGRRFANLANFVTEGVEPEVARAYSAALRALEAAGARIEDVELREISQLPTINSGGGFAASEAFHWHRPLIAEQGARYDPRILKRILRGERMGASDYIGLLAARRTMVAAVAARTEPFDAVLCPTVPLVPPPVAAVEDEAEYGRINLLLLRNTTVANFLDRCAVSIPCHAPGEAPVGLMLMGERGADAKLLALAAACEAALDGA